MRNISWFILAIGSALIWGNTASFAQDAPRPPVQVVIGPNGVKVIDPKTGKEVPSVVTRTANVAPRIHFEIDLDKKPSDSAHIRVGDRLYVHVADTLPNQPIKGVYKVEPSGKVPLGAYGRVLVAGLTPEAAEARVREHLASIIKNPSVSLTWYDPIAHGEQARTDRVTKQEKPPGVFELELDLQLQQAHKELLRAIQLQKAKEGPKVDSIEFKQMEFKLVPGPDGKAIIVAMQRKAEPLSTDKKIDLLLKQVGELRSDVDAIKKMLDVKPGTTGGGWQWYYPKAEKSPDKKPDKATLDNLKAIEEALRNYQDKKGPDKKKEAGKGPDKKTPANSEAEVERRLERILQEAEELRREIRKLQTPKKK